jgi:pilus assembly protein CpaB
MRRQRMLFTGGLLLGLLGAALTLTYVRGVEARARSKGEMVPAYVATQSIPAGTSGSVLTDLVERRDIPKAYVAPGAVGSIDQVAGEFALREIPAGDTLTAGDFGTAGETVSRLAIPRGYEAVAVATTVDGGLAEYAAPGDTVSVYATFRGPHPITRKILANVTVLATRPNPEQAPKITGGASPNGTQLLVLALKPKQAQRLVFGQELGSLWFSLVPQGQTSPEIPDYSLDFAGSL